MMNWQPYSTAPKDGTEILLVCPGGQSDHYHVVYWDDEDGPPAWRSRYGGCEAFVLTEAEILGYHTPSSWCELEPPTNSLCYLTPSDLENIERNAQRDRERASFSPVATEITETIRQQGRLFQATWKPNPTDVLDDQFASGYGHHVMFMGGKKVPLAPHRIIVHGQGPKGPTITTDGVVHDE